MDEIRGDRRGASAPRLRRGRWPKPRRKGLILAFAIIVLLGVVGTAVGVGISLLSQQEQFDKQRGSIPGEPERIGPFVEITSGPGWSLVGWRSDRGICLDLAVQGNSGGGCGFGVRGEPHASNGPQPEHWISVSVSDAPGSSSVIAGVVAKQVDRVDVVLGDGSIIETQVIEAPAELQADVAFLFVRLPAEKRELLNAVVAYDRTHEVLERLELPSGN